MIGCLRTRVRKQPINALYFEFETVLKFYNLEAWCEPDVYIFLPTLSVVYKFNLLFNYQGPGVLCPLTIGISAVDYFVVLIDNCP